MMVEADYQSLVDWYEDVGVDEVIADPRKVLTRPVSSPATPERSVDVSPNEAPHVIATKARIIADSCKTIEELKQAVLNFDGCILKKTATNTVFSDGNSKASVMFIGEAPGANEDKYGIPFCGESGKLLDAMFASIGLDRATVYISNTIFWRPPGNRRPTAEEVAICRPFVEKHIALVQPKLLVLVGGTAASSLLDTKDGVTKLRQQAYHYSNPYLKAAIPAITTFHPAYLLRQPSQKKLAWHDFLRIRQQLIS